MARGAGASGWGGGGSGAGGAKGRREQYGASGGMATLKGSEKQVAYAADIRKTANSALDDMVGQLKSQSAKFGESQVKGAIEKAERMRSVINKTEDAGAIVEFFGGYVSGKSGQSAKQAAMSAITSSVRLKTPKNYDNRETTAELRKKLIKAFNGG